MPCILPPKMGKEKQMVRITIPRCHENHLLKCLFLITYETFV